MKTEQAKRTVFGVAGLIELARNAIRVSQVNKDNFPHRSPAWVYDHADSPIKLAMNNLLNSIDKAEKSDVLAIANRIDSTTEFDGAKAIENLEELLKALQPFASHFVPDGMEDIGGGALTVTFKLQVYKDAIAALSKCRKDGGK